MSEIKFEPFQRVLVRQQNESSWRDALFSHKVGTGAFCISCAEFHASSKFWMQCLPYEGNEHLLGTTNSPTSPELDFKFGDHVEVRNDKYNDWKKALFCNRNDGLNICLAIGDSMVTGWRHCRRAEW